jgi:hypothetical protein
MGQFVPRSFEVVASAWHGGGILFASGEGDIKFWFVYKTGTYG